MGATHIKSDFQNIPKILLVETRRGLSVHDYLYPKVYPLGRGVCEAVSVIDKFLRRHGGHEIRSKPQNSPPPQETAPHMSRLILNATRTSAKRLY